jgi:MYXO-CTERM domain-containing protein
MPKCDFSAQSPNACIGSGTYTHLGLNLIQQNIADYQAECSVMGYAYPCSDATEYINILITDGKYNSTDPQVQMPLETMFNDDITTYVIGFGDAVDVTQLNKMADWGSGATLDYYDANNQDALEMALADIIEGLTFDECCQFNDCTQIPEPTTEEPDPMVISTESASDTDTSTGPGTDSADDTTTGTTEPVDPTTGTDGDPTGNTTIGETGDTDPDTSAGETANLTDSAGETANVPTTGPDTPTEPNPTQTTPGGEESTAGADSESETEATVGGVDDEGCGCKVDDEQGKTRGLLGTLLTLGMAGFMRRRRRSA